MGNCPEVAYYTVPYFYELSRTDLRVLSGTLATCLGRTRPAVTCTSTQVHTQGAGCTALVYVGMIVESGGVAEFSLRPVLLALAPFVAHARWLGVPHDGQGARRTLIPLAGAAPLDACISSVSRAASTAVALLLRTPAETPD